MSGTDYTQTTNLGLYKPIFNKAVGTWGNYWNSNADTLDTALAQATTVKGFGAKGDGVTNDAPAFAAALAAVAAGGTVIVPAGTYNIAAPLSQALTGTVSFVGDGSGVTILNFSAANDGLAFSLTPAAAVHIRGMTIARLVASPAYANTGLSIVGPSPQASRPSIPTIQDVFLMGNAARTTGWATGISITNVSQVSFIDVFVSMPNADGSGQGTGVSLLGQSASSYLVEAQFNGLSTLGGSVGLEIGTWIQGVYLNDCRLIGNDYGIRWDGNNTHADLALLVTNTHCNSSTRNVYVYQATGLIFTNMVMLQFPSPSLTGDWAAFEIIEGAGVTLANNNILGESGTTGGQSCMILTSGNTTTVTGNLFGLYRDYAIILNSMNDMSVIGNVAYSTGATGLISMTGAAGNILRLANQFNGVADLNLDPATNYLSCYGINSGGDINGATNLYVANNSIFGNVGSNSNPRISINGPAGQSRLVEFATNALGRWFIGANGDAESGSNAGSNFILSSGADSGSALIGQPFIITRATGVVTFSAAPQFSPLPFVNAANDAAAAGLGIPVGGTYRNGSALMVRVA